MFNVRSFQAAYLADAEAGRIQKADYGLLFQVGDGGKEYLDGIPVRNIRHTPLELAARDLFGIPLKSKNSLV